MSERSDAQRDTVETIGAESPSDANLQDLEGEEEEGDMDTTLTPNHDQQRESEEVRRSIFRRGPPERFAPGVVNVTKKHGGARNVPNTLQTMAAPEGATAMTTNAQRNSSHPSKTGSSKSKRLSDSARDRKHKEIELR